MDKTSPRSFYSIFLIIQLGGDEPYSIFIDRFRTEWKISSNDINLMKNVSLKLCIALENVVIMILK